MRQVPRTDLTTFMRRLSWNPGASTSWHPKGLSRLVQRIALPVLTTKPTQKPAPQHPCVRSDSNVNIQDQTPLSRDIPCCNCRIRNSYDQVLKIWLQRCSCLPPSAVNSVVHCRGSSSQVKAPPGTSFASRWYSELNYGSLFFIKQTALQMQTHRGQQRQGADTSEKSGTEKHYFSLTTLATWEPR